MISLQILQLTEHGRYFISSRRKTLAIATGVLVASGTAAYMQLNKHGRNSQSTLLDDQSLPWGGDKIVNGEEKPRHKKKLIVRKRKGRLRSLHVLTAILLSRMGQMGARNLLSLVAILVLQAALGNRLAKVQGFLFRAAFLRRVPIFLHLIMENLLLCFLQSTLHSTTKYLTGNLSLLFRKILTDLIHADYFENMAYYKISHVDDRITNPEQRMASDVPRFCSELSEVVQEDLTAVLDGQLYTWRLCSYASPKYVFWMLAYVLGVGTVIKNFSPAFGKLISKEQQLEGEYRQLHSRLRTNAESVAFYGGENQEASHIQQKFCTLVKHMNSPRPLVVWDYRRLFIEIS